MEPRERRVHGVVDRCAFGGLGIRHVRLPDDAALDVVHEIEGGTGDARVIAVEQRRGDWKFLRVQRADHAELAVDRMRGRKQLTRRLAAQHVAARGRLEQIGGIGLAALELAHAQRGHEVRQARGEINFEPRGIERERAANVLGAGKRGLAIDRRHGDSAEAGFWSWCSFLSSTRGWSGPSRSAYAGQRDLAGGALPRAISRYPLLDAP